MASYLGRRKFLAALGGAAAWPIAARAQQPGKLPTIGFLGVDATVWAPWTAAFVARLRQLGWIEGRTIAIEYRWSEGRAERDAEIAAEFVRLKVDVIVTKAPAVAALKQATAIIPIVFPIAVDPVGGGLVASLARPGGNVTGLSLQSPDLAGKRRISLPPSRRSRPNRTHKRTHFTSWATHSPWPTAHASTRLHSARGCRRSSVPAIKPKPAVSSHTDQMSRIYSCAPATTSTRYCAVRSPAIFRSSSRLDSISSSI